jgi:hypothetical protein
VLGVEPMPGRLEVVREGRVKRRMKKTCGHKKNNNKNQKKKKRASWQMDVKRVSRTLCINKHQSRGGWDDEETKGRRI